MARSFRTGEEIIRFAEEPAGYWRLYLIHQDIENDRPLSREHCEWLRKAIDKVLDGQDPNKALQLERRRGAKATAAKQDRKLALAVLVVDAMKRGEKKDAALESVSASAHVSRDTLERYYKTHRKEALTWWRVGQTTARLLTAASGAHALCQSAQRTADFISTLEAEAALKGVKNKK